MDFSDDESESESESEREDSALNEDIGDLLLALRRRCDHTDATSSDGGGGGDSSSEDGDGDGGILLRLKQRFGGEGGEASTCCPSSPSLPFVEPLCTLPPERNSLANDGLKGHDSDDDDDLETLRAIQRRFSHYEAEALKSSESTDYSLQDKPNKEDYSEIQSQFDPTALDQSTFPKSAQFLIDALKKNRSCQKFVRRKLMEIETKIEENKELRDRVKCLMDFQVACKKRVSCAVSQKRDPRARLISVEKPIDLDPRKKNRRNSALNYGPAENSRVSNFREVQKQFPMWLKKKPWSDEERENLFKGIKQQYQETILLNAINIESDTEGANNMEMLPYLSNTDLEITPEKMRAFVPMINWNRLASMYLPSRTGPECESRFLNCEDQLINHSPWNSLEDKKLLYTVQNRGIYNWVEISVLLSTNRTPYQCLVRYQRSLNPLILNRDWTEEEDRKLLEAVGKFGEKNWQVVAGCLVGRIANQCSNRWTRTLNPEIKSVGRWSLEEDKRLKIATLLFGTKNWSKIAQFVPGRTGHKCRERWVNCLDPALNLKPWTEEEDSMLLEAAKTHGNCWSKVSSFFPSRTDNQCWRRWKTLCKEELTQLQIVRKIKRTVLISNFVHRKHERPGIGPDDFTLTPLLTSQNYENTPEKKSRKTRKKSKDSKEKSVEENQTSNDDNQSKKRKRTPKSKENENNNNNENENNNSNNNKNKRQRKSDDPAWIHAEKLEGKKLHWKCKYCNKLCKGGGISRLKMHIAGIAGDVTLCPDVPLEIRKSMIDEWEKSGKEIPVKKKKVKNEKETGEMEGVEKVKGATRKRKRKECEKDVVLAIEAVNGELNLVPLQLEMGSGEMEGKGKGKGKGRKKRKMEYSKDAVLGLEAVNNGGLDPLLSCAGTGEKGEIEGVKKPTVKRRQKVKKKGELEQGEKVAD